MVVKDKAPRKVRQCPHCKSKKGFQIFVRLGGYLELRISFAGKVIESERNGSDDIEKYASCLECGKRIGTDILDIKNV